MIRVVQNLVMLQIWLAGVAALLGKWEEVVVEVPVRVMGNRT